MGTKLFNTTYLRLSQSSKQFQGSLWTLYAQMGHKAAEWKKRYTNSGCLEREEKKIKAMKICQVAQQKENKLHVLEGKQEKAAADSVTRPQTHTNMQTQEKIEDYKKKLMKGNQSQCVKEA